MSRSRQASRQMVANRAASRLESVESSLDAALHELGLMCADLPQMRQDAQLGAAYGQDLFEAAGLAYARTVEARKQAISMHEGFERIRVQLNLPPTRAGSGIDKPPYDEVMRQNAKVA